MKKIGIILISGFCMILFVWVCFLPACSKNENETVTDDTWDIDVKGIPKFVSTNYIELEKIYRISKFRSSVGHDYSDAFEHCRSMKHYFEPKATVDWGSIKIYSPVAGTITRVEQEWAGTKLEIASETYPAFRFSIFHINLLSPLLIDQKVTEGQQLGTHVGSATMSDISVIVNDPTKQGRMVSYFQVMTDAVFSQYQSRGIFSRDSLIIKKEQRDAFPLSCSGDTFTGDDSLEAWVALN